MSVPDLVVVLLWTSVWGLLVGVSSYRTGYREGRDDERRAWSRRRAPWA